MAVMTRSPETSDSLLLSVRDTDDRAAWDQFVAIYRPMVYRIGRRAGLQDSDAEDLAQRVMISVAGAIPDWEKDPHKGGFRGWLNRIARNALISMLRSRKLNDVHGAIGKGGLPMQLLSPEAPDDEIDRIIRQEHHRSRLRWAAEQVRHEFTQPTWRAFWLTTLGEVSVPDAAKQLQISVGSVYAAHSRIMRKLQELARDSDLFNAEDCL